MMATRNNRTYHWTEEELALLKEMVFSGKSMTAITAKLKRPAVAIKDKLRTDFHLTVSDLRKMGVLPFV